MNWFQPFRSTDGQCSLDSPLWDISSAANSLVAITRSSPATKSLFLANSTYGIISTLKVFILALRSVETSGLAVSSSLGYRSKS